MKIVSVLLSCSVIIFLCWATYKDTENNTAVNSIDKESQEVQMPPNKVSTPLQVLEQQSDQKNRTVVEANKFDRHKVLSDVKKRIKEELKKIKPLVENNQYTKKQMDHMALLQHLYETKKHENNKLVVLTELQLSGAIEEGLNKIFDDYETKRKHYQLNSPKASAATHEKYLKELMANRDSQVKKIIKGQLLLSKYENIKQILN